MLCVLKNCVSIATIKHHIRYFPEETTGVCEKCHDKIHSGKYPLLTEQYIHYTKGDAQIFYSQKERIEEAIKRICRRK